jgi:hypothetical protein
MRRPELIFLHSVSADGFDVYRCCGAGTRNTDRQFWICVSRFPLEVPSAYKTFVSSTSASSRSPFGSDLGKLGQQIGIRGRPSNG